MTTSSPGCRRSDGQRGAALLLFLIVAITLGLAMLIRNQVAPEGLRLARDERTDQALALAKAALVGYAATYRDSHPDQPFGYLPCPDSNGDGEADASAGGCAPAAAGRAAVGLLPYKRLDLPDLRDSDGVCLWYAVSGNFKASTTKFEPMNWDTQGQFAIRDAATAGAATPTVLTAPNDASGGAAAVVIAVGAPLPGQGRSAAATTCGVAPAEVAAYLDGGYDFNTAATVNLNHGPARNAAGNLTNNDHMVWISPKEIFSAVKRRSDFSGPLSGGHLNRLVDDLAVALSSGAELPAPKTPQQVGSRKRGEVPDGLSVSMPDYFTNWRNQFRYIKCDTGKCLNTGACAGVLMFAGQHTTNGPRASSEVGIASRMFEGDRLDTWNGTVDTFTVNASYLPAAPTADVTRCLNPQPSVLSFAADIASLSPQAVVYTQGSTVAVDTTTKTLTLGDADLSSGQVNPDDPVPGTHYDAALLFGCSWFGSTVSFTTRLIAYFRYTIANDGNGFVFTLADADPARNNDVLMCGRSGSSLGYSGLANDGDPIPGLSLDPINFPKLGLEIDTREDASSSNDPDDKHLALVFWKDPVGDDEDNKHGAGRSPAVGSTGVAQDKGFLRQTAALRHVRLEITRSRPTSTQTRLVITAWVFPDDPGTPVAGLSNTILSSSFDDSGLDPDDFAKVQQSIDIDDVTAGTEALRNLWVGFTNGTASNAQVIQITDFILNAQ